MQISKTNGGDRICSVDEKTYRPMTIHIPPATEVLVVADCWSAEPEADEEAKPFANHLSHLAVHGFLHLVGYDHENEEEAEEMEQMEREILATLGIPDPYADSDPQASRGEVI